jgi:hypothetical protein
LTIVSIVAEKESVGRFSTSFALKKTFVAGDGKVMNTKALGTLQLVLLLAVIGLASTAAAQDDGSQPRPRWRARTAARQYPDDEVPARAVTVSNDVEANSPPLPITVESPSNQPARRARVKATGEPAVATMDTVPESVPAPRATRTGPNPVNRRFDPDEVPGPAMEQGEVYGDEAQCGDDEFGAWVPNMRSAAHGRLWFGGESLLWWLKGAHTPPLLTTSPAGSTALSAAGVLPDATVLVGNQDSNPGLHAGARLHFGAWLGDCEESGLEITYLIMGQNTESGSSASMGNPILARPFFNTTTGAEDSHVIAFPDVANGTFNASSTENFQGAEIMWRRAIIRGGDGRIDLLAGYRFNRLTDGLEIADSTSGTSAPGTTISTADSFHTKNDFNGGNLGFATQWRRGRWSLETLLKMGIGQTNTDVFINGATAVTSGGTTTHLDGGLLALPSNMGNHGSSQFSVMPEIGFTLACDVTPRLKASVGYTLLYWSNVARPGDQIDLNIDTNQFPPPIAAGEKPAFVLHTSDFWAQGVNLGLDYRF